MIVISNDERTRLIVNEIKTNQLDNFDEANSANLQEVFLSRGELLAKFEELHGLVGASDGGS